MPMIDFDRYDFDASELHDEGDEEPCEFCRGPYTWNIYQCAG